MGNESSYIKREGDEVTFRLDSAYIKKELKERSYGWVYLPESKNISRVIIADDVTMELAAKVKRLGLHYGNPVATFSPPEALEKFMGLMYLSCRGSRLVALPTGIEHFPSLKRVWLEDAFVDSRLEKKSDGVTFRLDADYVRKESWERSDGRVYLPSSKNISRVIIADDVSAELAAKVKELSLRSNPVATFSPPKALAKFTGLTSLECRGSRLVNLPTGIEHFPSLEKVELDDDVNVNVNVNVNVRLEKKRDEVTFRLDSAYIKKELKERSYGWVYLPESKNISRMIIADDVTMELAAKVKRLGLHYGNPVATFSPPEALAKFTGLTDLHCRDSRLVALPTGIENFPSLETVWLDDAFVDSRLEKKSDGVTFRLDADYVRKESWERSDGRVYLPSSKNISRVIIADDVSAELAAKVKVLSLRSNPVATFSPPEALAKFTGLTTLDCNGSRLVALPTGIEHLPSLKKVLLDDDTFVNARLEKKGDGVTFFRLDTDYIRKKLWERSDGRVYLPESKNISRVIISNDVAVELAAKVKLLDLRSNPVATFSPPEALAKFTGLTDLYCRGSRLVALPTGIEHLPSLETVLLTDDASKMFRLVKKGDELFFLLESDYLRKELKEDGSVSLPKRKFIERVMVDKNIETDLAAKVKLLSLSSNTVATFSPPEALVKLTGLTTVDCNGSRLVAFPMGIEHLPSLEKIELNHTFDDDAFANARLEKKGEEVTFHLDADYVRKKLWERSDGCVFLPSNKDISHVIIVDDVAAELAARVKLLSLSSNPVATISPPTALAKFTGLTTLNCQDSEIDAVPRGINNLPFLEKLEMSGNKNLKTIPTGKYLKHINIDDCGIQDLPFDFFHYGLERISMRGNKGE